MKLHLDKDAFRLLIEKIHESSGYRTDVLEKDYYVTLILDELSKKQKEGLPAYFKGGTALYKALKTTNRFSEDIDLSVDTRNCTRSQNDKRLNDATKKYKELNRDSNLGETNGKEVIAVYKYDPVTIYDINDELQRFGFVKIEATSFTISEPVEVLEIVPMLYDLATNEQKEILKNSYDIKPFNIQTITLERIFIDKLFAAESYVRKSNDQHRAFEAAKHIYDLTVLSKEQKILNLLSNLEKIKNLLAIRIEEELNRHDGIPGILPKDFIFFNTIKNNNEVRSAYSIMQKQYVLREKDKIEFDDACDAVGFLNKKLSENSSWNS